MLVKSIFNNVIGPVMRGPSSSHTAASVRIGQLAAMLLAEEPVHAVFYFDPSGSLATTYRGQGSAMGLAAGLLGMPIEDPRLVDAEKMAVEKGLRIEYIIEPYGAVHPNTYRSVVTGQSGKSVEFTALSTGGGIIRLVELNGRPVDNDFEYINHLMPVAVRTDAKLLFADNDGFMAFCSREGQRLSDAGREYECSVGNIDAEGVDKLAAGIREVMSAAVKTGMAGTTFKDRILHHQSHLLKAAETRNALIPGGLVNRIIEAVTAIMEAKSSMGLIVASPTAGSCGTLGGTLLPVAEAMRKDDKAVSDAIIAAGMAGIAIDTGAGFAAEEGGCQYECGAASAMTAAALVDLAGGDGKTALAAASMALQNTLGMICDPVADRVEVPCLGKNIMAGLNALAAANMALAGFDQVIPFNEVISAMKEVGEAMDHRFRCTCKGGLSVTPSALNIYSKINKPR